MAAAWTKHPNASLKMLTLVLGFQQPQTLMKHLLQHLLSKQEQVLPVIPDKTLLSPMVNNCLGFLSTCNCPCPDTNDLNNVEIEITFADEQVFSGACGT